MKKLIMYISLLCSISIFPDEPNKQIDEDFSLLQEAIEIVASMSDNIANLVIQHKEKSNTPEMTKQECVTLVQKMTSFVVAILKKQKLKKMSRSISFTFSLNTEKEIDTIAENLIRVLNHDH